MAKKLLSEAQMRRFAKLACLPAVNEMKYNRDDEELEEGKAGDFGNKSDPNTVPKGFVNEQEEEEEELLPDEEAPPVGDEPMDAEMPEEPPMDDMGAEGELDLTDEEAQAIIDLGKKLEAALPAGGEEMGEEPPMDDMGAEMPEEPMGDMGALEDEEEEIMEALRGINYVPGKKEIVEEVARRVAKRLMKAKRAEKQLQEALGKKRAARRTRK